MFCGVVPGIFSSLAIILLRKRELVAILKLCCWCLFSVPRSHGAVGWSAVCDCGISWSVSLVFPYSSIRILRSQVIISKKKLHFFL